MATVLSSILCVLFVASTLFTVQGQQQIPLVKDGDIDLIYELKKAEIIPTVLDTFTPLISINVTWKNATADYGNTLNPSKTKKQPSIELTALDVDDSIWSSIAIGKDKKLPQLTIAVSDPDAPSRDNPEWSEICHWIVTDVGLSTLDKAAAPAESDSDNAVVLKKRMLDVMPYKPPGPPPKTGKHRYVFVALAPKNGTTEKLHLTKPGDRQHWGFKDEREGLRDWAGKMGLGVVGANFIYEQNDEQ